MSKKKYFSDNGLTHLRDVLKIKIKQIYVGKVEPIDENVVVWIDTSGESVTVPKKTSELENDSGFIDDKYVQGEINKAILQVLGGAY